MRIGLFFIAVLAVASSSCSLFEGDKEFLVQADSVSGPSSVSAGATFQLTVHGWVGPDGCSAFKEFRGPRNASGAEVTVIGVRRTGEGDCTMAPVELHLPFVVYPPVTDPYVLRIHQRDGTILSKTIRVQ
jgi:hypothetical protein